MVGLYRESLALSVKREYFIPLIIIKALVRKVLHIAILFWELKHYRLTILISYHLLPQLVPNEMIMGQTIIVEEIDEYKMVLDEAARDEGVVEPGVRHCVVI